MNLKNYFHKEIFVIKILCFGLQIYQYYIIVPLTIDQNAYNIQLIYYHQVEELKFNINQLSKKGYNPVHYAAYYGNIEMLKLLLSYSPNINIKNKFGETIAEISKKKLKPETY